MKRTRRLKHRPIANTDEFILLVNQIADLQASVKLIAGERDRELQTVQSRHAGQLAGLSEAINAKLALADAYARAHRGELLPAGRKSVAGAQAAYGFRTGNRTVKLAGNKVTPCEAIARLKAAGLTAYVRIAEEIAKERILADAVDDATLPASESVTSRGEMPGSAPAARHTLTTLGLKIVRTESFYIEPKAEAGATLRQAQAA